MLTSTGEAQHGMHAKEAPDPMPPPAERVVLVKATFAWGAVLTVAALLQAFCVTAEEQMQSQPQMSTQHSRCITTIDAYMLTSSRSKTRFSRAYCMPSAHHVHAARGSLPARLVACKLPSRMQCASDMRDLHTHHLGHQGSCCKNSQLCSDDHVGVFPDGTHCIPLQYLPCLNFVSNTALTA